MRKEDFVDYHLKIRASGAETEPDDGYNEQFTQEDENALSEAWDNDAGLEMLAKEVEEAGNDVAEHMEEEGPEQYREQEDKKRPSRNWQYPSDLKALEQEFAESYISYMITFDPEIEQMLEEKMLLLLTQLCTYKIYLRIWDHEAYNQGEEEKIASEGNSRSLKLLREQKEKGTFLSNENHILRCYRRIYKNLTFDFFTNAAREARLFSRMPTDEDGNDISDHRPEFGVPFADPFEGGKRSPREIALMRKILRWYFQGLMDYPDDPSKALAVMYARVLYQMEPFGDPEGIVRATEAAMRRRGWSTDPDSVNYEFHWFKAQEDVRRQPAGSSPAWAWARMEDRNLELLEDDSEDSIQRNFDGSLAWGVSMRGKLEEVPTKYAPTKWGELVYTECFTKSDIQSWSDSVHESTMKKTAKKMSMDAECCKDAEKLMKKSHPLMDEFIKRTNKKQNKARKGATRDASERGSGL